MFVSFSFSLSCFRRICREYSPLLRHTYHRWEVFRTQSLDNNQTMQPSQWLTLVPTRKREKKKIKKKMSWKLNKLLTTTRIVIPTAALTGSRQQQMLVSGRCWRDGPHLYTLRKGYTQTHTHALIKVKQARVAGRPVSLIPVSDRLTRHFAWAIRRRRKRSGGTTTFSF